MNSINPVPIMNTKKKPGQSTNKNRVNWLLYQLFARHVQIKGTNNHL